MARLQTIGSRIGRLDSRTAKQARDRRHDAHRYAAKPWRAWSQRKEWKHRREAQLAKQPLCERHLAQDRVVPATVANHKTPHRGNWELFIQGELESLCKSCHDDVAQGIEERGYDDAIGSDGLPLGRNHPFLEG